MKASHRRIIGFLVIGIALLVGCHPTYEYDAHVHIVDAYVTEEGELIKLSYDISGVSPYFGDLNKSALLNALSVREIAIRRNDDRFLSLQRQVTAQDGRELTLVVDVGADLESVSDQDSPGILGDDLHITNLSFSPSQSTEVPIRNQFYLLAPPQNPGAPEIDMILFSDNTTAREHSVSRFDIDFPGRLNRYSVGRSFIGKSIALRFRSEGRPDRPLLYIAPDGSVQRELVAVDDATVFEPGATLDLSELVIDYTYEYDVINSLAKAAYVVADER